MRTYLACMLVVMSSCNLVSAKKGKLVIVVPNEKTLRIGIVDTGFNAGLSRGNVKICNTGHWNIPGEKFELSSVHPHGTVVAQAIADVLGDSNYCLVIVTALSASRTVWIPQAVRYLGTIGVKLINISMADSGYWYEEESALEFFSNLGGKAFIAAGNEHQDLDKVCNVYPACYTGISGDIVVGATEREQIADYSNYGKQVSRWYEGSIKLGTEWKGTSFASPRALAAYAAWLLAHPQ